ncbi:protein-disulfide reductase DsbD [Burkholderiaceae bacterium DAT-1]|nr:protein-disulfide reductase DsbD [Burkholderiaceae bacterium DAT-1]
MKNILKCVLQWSCLMLCLAASAHADDLLAVEEAFKPSLIQKDANTLVVHYEVADGYYVYRDRFKFLRLPDNTPVEAKIPPGKKKHDEYFGEVEYYRHAVDVELVSPDGFPAGTKISATSQGCADAGVCYPPMTVELTAAVATASAPASAKAADLIKDAAAAAPATSGDDAAQVFKDRGLFAVILFFFLAGLGLAFTACMYPLLPIISGIVVGQGQANSKMRSFTLSFVYVQGMAVTYAIAGIAAALSGSLISNALQNAWVLGAFGGFFVLMSLSMFGLFELQLPNALQSKLNDTSNRLPGGKWVPVFGMGALSALIVGPCVAPPLAAALGYIGASHDVLTGGLALYAMALGIGAPLIVVAVLGGHAMPKAGPWMTHVRQVFGVIMLLLALWMTRPVLPDWVFMGTLGVLAIGAGVQLSALDSIAHPTGWKRIWKSLGVVLLLVGVAQLLGVLAGSRDPLQPLRGVFGGGQVQAAEAPLPFKGIASEAELDAAIAAAQGKHVMLDFYADWCVSCKEMEHQTFTDAAVRAKLASVVLLKVDVTDNSANAKALLKRFGLFGPPGTIFYNHAGAELRAQRLVGFEAPAAFVQRLERVLANQG